MYAYMHKLPTHSNEKSNGKSFHYYYFMAIDAIHRFEIFSGQNKLVEDHKHHATRNTSDGYEFDG